MKKKRYTHQQNEPDQGYFYIDVYIFVYRIINIKKANLLLCLRLEE